MPQKNEEDVIFVCAASFTGELLDEFKHSNIAGHHGDMGRGWNYSWYPKDDGKVKELFTTPGQYTTNWIAFYD
ncbi:MAG: hypothetical protein IKW89_00115 [Bacteroidales bacterium]|nr:hypothetical protein [Bacteroidales bacterium]